MIIAPSILSLDYSKFNEQLNVINDNCKWIHFDVMDGHFVPNLSFGPDIFKTFRKHSDLFMDVHLMVEDPKYFSEVFIKAGADNITFHNEVIDDYNEKKELINYIHDNYCKAGISINPNHDIYNLYPLLQDVDLVLIMSVYPGYGGQSFIEDTYSRIKELDNYRKQNNLNFKIEVDGGINDKNAFQLKNCGADILVVGSHLFKGDLKNNIDVLNNI